MYLSSSSKSYEKKNIESIKVSIKYLKVVLDTSY
jgi:hypothetical protein